MGATTVYVTHDQLEAMQMGDKIVVMNHGVIEQFGTPQDIYDKPATMFVADFIGSPPMNFLRFHGEVHAGASKVMMHHEELDVPRLMEPFEGDMVFGIRPEHIRLNDSGSYRGEVLAAEYLGTTQIVTLKTASGELKARIPSDQPVRAGEFVGLEFNGSTVTLFDNQSGRALRSELNEGVLAHG
jgi:multiple sugar transport system ATP-binding protein